MAKLKTLDGVTHHNVPQHLIVALQKAGRPFQTMKDLVEFAKGVDSPHRIGGERHQPGPQVQLSGGTSGMVSATA